MRGRTFLAALPLAAGLTVAVPAPATAVYVPRTLALSVAVGPGEVVDPAFAADFVAVRWQGEHGAAAVRTRSDGKWGAWVPLAEDGVEVEGEYASAPLATHGADAVQVRVPRGVRRARVTAINTTDGELLRVGTVRRGAEAATPVITRAGWGADESLRFDGSTERFPPVYWPVQKLTVHHSATSNNDADPAATMRAIYYMHTIERGFGDIGYQFLIGPQGQVYEGRWSGTDGDPAHDAAGKGVAAAHVANNNSGNLGVSVLGTFTSSLPTAAARSSLESVLADLAARHNLDPQGTSTFTNPSSGATKPNMPTISGHRDWLATECPGGTFYAQLASVRAAVAERLLGAVRTDSLTRSSARVRWTTLEASTGQVEYWTTGAPRRTPTVTTRLTDHAITLRFLRPATRYSYRVKGRDASGHLRTSAVRTFTTPRG